VLSIRLIRVHGTTFTRRGFATIGHPVVTADKSYDAGYLFTLQVMLDVILLAVFLAGFVGRITAFGRIQDMHRKKDTTRNVE
jgi:uncharacterized membrane protein